MPDGSIDTTNGKQEGSTLGERKYHLPVNYEKHIHFLLGTASVLLLDGILEGHQPQIRNIRMCGSLWTATSWSTVRPRLHELLRYLTTACRWLQATIRRMAPSSKRMTSACWTE